MKNFNTGDIIYIADCDWNIAIIRAEVLSKSWIEDNENRHPHHWLYKCKTLDGVSYRYEKKNFELVDLDWSNIKYCFLSYDDAALCFVNELEENYNNEIKKKLNKLNEPLAKIKDIHFCNYRLNKLEQQKIKLQTKLIEVNSKIKSTRLDLENLKLQQTEIIDKVEGNK